MKDHPDVFVNRGVEGDSVKGSTQDKEMDQPPLALAHPHLSPDGLWWWNGQIWVPVTTGSHPLIPPDQQVENGAQSQRNEWRVALLTLIAGGPYLIWWTTYLRNLAKRERLPNARVSRVVGALVDEERGLTGRASTSAKVMWLWWSGAIFYLAALVFWNEHGWLYGSLFVVGAALTAIVGFKVQTSANRYLRAKYPRSANRGMTRGEVIASILGVLLGVLWAIHA